MTAQAINQLLPGTQSISRNLISAFETAQFMAENWQTLFLMMVEETKLFASNAGQSIMAFVRYAGQLGSWLANSWKDVMLSMADIVLGIMANLGTNIRGIWKATMDFVAGKGFKFNPTPLLKGTEQAVERILQTMPKMAAAAMKQTTPQLEQLKRELQAAAEEFERRKQGAKFNAAPESLNGDFGEEGAPGQEQGNAGGTGGKKSGGIQSLIEYARGLQQSALSSRAQARPVGAGYRQGHRQDRQRGHRGQEDCPLSASSALIRVPMQPIEAYRRYAAMKDRSAFPVELGHAYRIDGHDVAALRIDTWAVTMTVFAKLGRILEHADSHPDLFLHPSPTGLYGDGQRRLHRIVRRGCHGRGVVVDPQPQHLQRRTAQAAHTQLTEPTGGMQWTRRPISRARRRATAESTPTAS